MIRLAKSSGKQLESSSSAARAALSKQQFKISSTLNRSGAYATRTNSAVNLSCPSRYKPCSVAILTNRSLLMEAPYARTGSATSYRWLSSNPTGKQEGGETGTKHSTPVDDGSGNSAELAKLTPGEKVVVGTRLAMWAGIAVFAATCAYYIGKELLPSKMSPNSVFDTAFEKIRHHPEILQRFGEPLKAYGRDHGGHREGRRNFIEHTQYTSKDDGSKRTRVRFNLEGQFGQAFVFAEVSADMPSGEFVYLLVQDKRNGRVITVIDNRAALTAKRMAGGSKEGMEAFQNLLGGGRAGGASSSGTH